MFKDFPKINAFVIAIFIFGILLGVLSGIGIGIKYLFENKTPPSPSETPKEETRTVTGWVKFRTCAESKISQWGLCDMPGIGGVLLAIVGQDGKIIKTITTDKNGEAETEITVPLDLLFSLTPKMSAERGIINVVSFKEGYVETVILNIPVFPGRRQIDEGIAYDIQIRPLMPPGQRNYPNSIDVGGLRSWHRLEILDFIEGVADALNLKPAYY